MMREISAALIGAYILIIVVGVVRLSQGQAAYEAFLSAVWSQFGITFSIVALLFAFYHSYTWFQVTPKAMPLRLAGKRVPGSVIVAAHWLGFAVASAALLALAKG
jgi:fumarate reductase subunit C